MKMPYLMPSAPSRGIYVPRDGESWGTHPAEQVRLLQPHRCGGRYGLKLHNQPLACRRCGQPLSPEPR